MKYRLKKWVVVTLITISCLLGIIASGECDNQIVDYSVKGFTMLILLVNGIILIKYGDLNREMGE